MTSRFPDLSQLEDHSKEFIQLSTTCKVAPTTLRQYQSMVAAIEAFGELNFKTVIEFIEDSIKFGKRSAPTLRSFMSAVKAAENINNKEYLSKAEWDLVGRVLAGQSAIYVPVNVKGQLTLTQLHQAIELAAVKGVLHLARGVTVLMAATLRPRDIKELTWSRVTKNLRSVIVRSKKWRSRGGVAFEPHKLQFQLGVDALARQLELKQEDDVLVFPEWSYHRANDLMKAAAAIYGWPKELKWTTHCLRHGGAGFAGAEAEPVEARQRAKDAGQWKSNAVDIYLPSSEARIEHLRAAPAQAAARVKAARKAVKPRAKK